MFFTSMDRTYNLSRLHKQQKLIWIMMKVSLLNNRRSKQAQPKRRMIGRLLRCLYSTGAAATTNQRRASLMHDIWKFQTKLQSLQKRSHRYQPREFPPISARCQVVSARPQAMQPTRVDSKWIHCVIVNQRSVGDSYAYIQPWEFPSIDNHGFSQPTVRHNLSQHEL